LGLVEQMVDAVDPDPGRLKEVVREIVEAKRRGDGAMPEGGLPALFATPEQRLTLNQISGMMSLLEGHGDVTMDRAGAGRVPSAERFSETLRQRRNSARGVNRIFQRLLGIDAKLAQYEAGEQFIAAVETAGGPALLDRAWERAENLPSLDEIKAPDLWIERVGGSSALDESARDEPVEVPGAVA
jgi:putative hydrolase